MDNTPPDGVYLNTSIFPTFVLTPLITPETRDIGTQTDNLPTVTVQTPKTDASTQTQRQVTLIPSTHISSTELGQLFEILTSPPPNNH